MRQLPAADNRAAVTWQHLDRDDDETVRAVISASGLDTDHDLLEAALAGAPRARLTQHADAVSLAFPAVRLVRATGQTLSWDRIETEPVVVLVAGRYVLTIGRPGVIDFDQAMDDIQNWLRAAATGNARAGESGPALPLLASLVFLAVVDQTVRAVEECAHELAADLSLIEQAAFADPTDRTSVSHSIYRYKRAATEIKRVAVPLQRPLRRVVLERLFDLDESVAGALSATGDSLARSVETVLYCDDAVNSIFHAHLTRIDLAQNADMRRIAAWGAILAAWGILAGVYQMTGDFTALHKQHGAAMFWFALTVGLVGSVALVFAFRRARWL